MTVASVPKAQTTAGAGGGNVSGTADSPAVTDLVQKALAAAPPSGSGLLTAISVIAAGFGMSWWIYTAINPADFMPSSDYTAFAGLFVASLGIERLLEPFSGFVVPSLEVEKQTRDSHVANAINAAPVTDALGASGQQPQAPPQAATGGTGAADDRLAGAGAPASAGLASVSPGGRGAEEGARQAAQAHWIKEAAKAQKNVNRLRATRGVFLWAVATVLAMLLAAVLGFFLLRSLETSHSPTAPPGVSIATNRKTGEKDPNRALDLLLTGLVVGAGTKPLHDLISQVQASKNNTKDPNATGTNAA